MDNPKYNSLTEKLIQNGILSSNQKNTTQENEDSIEKLYGIEPDEDMSHSPFGAQQPIKKENANPPKIKKRLNKYDLELLNESEQDETVKTHINSFKIIERFLNFKESMALKGNLKTFEKLFFAFFPKLYKARLVKDAMKKLVELNIDTKTLLDKTIPYGERENRYENLIKYLYRANEIQVKLKKKIN